MEIKAKLGIVIIAILILFTVFKICSEEVHIVKIGEDELEFNIPKDYNTLKSYYIEVINKYAESENQNIRLNGYISNYQDSIIQLKKDFDNVKLSVDNSEKTLKEYMKTLKLFSFYLGTGFSYTRIMSLNILATGDEYIFHANAYFGIRNIILSIGLDLGISNIGNSLGFIIGPTFQFLYKIY